MIFDLQLKASPAIVLLTRRVAPQVLDLLTELASARDFSSDFSIDFNGGSGSSAPAIASSTDILASSTSALASGT